MALSVTVQGKAISSGSTINVPYASQITVAWSGLESEYVGMEMFTYIDVTFSTTGASMAGNTGATNVLNFYLDRYGDLSSYASWSGYKKVGSSGSTVFTLPSSFVGSDITIDVSVSQQSTIYDAKVHLTTPYTACSAPTAVSISPTSVLPGANATLTYSGARSGTNNNITGYQFWRSTSAGGTYSRISSLDVTGLNVSGQDGTWTRSVPASGTNGETYYYKVLAVGAASGYSSSLSTVYGSVTAAVSSCTAPNQITLSASESTGANVTLEWSGAAGGTNNSIVGYDIYRREYDAGQGTWGSWPSTPVSSITSTSSSGSVSVAVPATLSNKYQYGVVVKGSAGSAYYSSRVASSNTVTRICTLTAPSNLAIASAESSTCVLSWTASSMTGASGQIAYSIRKNGTEVATTTGTSYTVPESITSTWGSSAVTITVVASYGGYSSSASSEVSYTYSTSITGATNVAVNPTSGQSTTVSWTAGSRGDGGSVTYDILINDTVIASDLTSTSYTISESIAASYGGQMSIKVRTKGASKYVDSSAVTFTYTAPHKYVKRWNGSAWERVIPYHWDGSAWAEIEPYRWNGSAWELQNN